MASAAEGLKEEVIRHIRIPVGQSFAGRIAAERVVWRVPDVKQIQIYSPVLRESRVCSLLGVPLIAHTGYGQEEDRRRSAEAGFDYHLVKPVDPEGLRRHLIKAGRPVHQNAGPPRKPLECRAGLNDAP